MKDVKSWFEHAGSLDAGGKEKEAEAAYRKVLALGVNGLPAKDQPCFYLQFGSTLRNTGKLAESERVLKQGIRKFPKFRALKLFLALTKHSAEDSSGAIRILLMEALEAPDTSTRMFSRALAYYAGKA